MRRRQVRDSSLGYSMSYSPYMNEWHTGHDTVVSNNVFYGTTDYAGTSATDIGPPHKTYKEMVMAKRMAELRMRNEMLLKQIDADRRASDVYRAEALKEKLAREAKPPEPPPFKWPGSPLGFDAPPKPRWSYRWPWQDPT